MSIIRTAETNETLVEIAQHSGVLLSSEEVSISSCANSLLEVEEAWRLVYERYEQMGFIEANDFGIYTTPKAVGPHACVFYGPTDKGIGYTMTVFHDNPLGLSLDSVYKSSLDQLRTQGRHLLEVGMLADRRHSAIRGIGALMDMMRWAVYFALYTHVTDIVVGVHPKHAPFYMRSYGFEKFAPPTTYDLVKDKPVVLLRLPLWEKWRKEVLPKGLAQAKEKPVPYSVFKNRFGFQPQQLEHSLMTQFLKTHHNVDPAHPEMFESMMRFLEKRKDLAQSKWVELEENLTNPSPSILA